MCETQVDLPASRGCRRLMVTPYRSSRQGRSGRRKARIGRREKQELYVLSKLHLFIPLINPAMGGIASTQTLPHSELRRIWGSTCPNHLRHPISERCICRYPHPSSPVGKQPKDGRTLSRVVSSLVGFGRSACLVPFGGWVWLRGKGRPEDGQSGGRLAGSGKTGGPLGALGPWAGRLAARTTVSWPGKGQNVH